MEKITIIDNEFVTMWYYPDKKIIHHLFHQFLYGQAFRDTLNAGLDIFKKYDAHKWLSDDRHNAALPKEDVDWAQTNWFPRVMNAGWKFWAVVMPEQVIGQMNMKRFVKNYSEQGLIVQVFGDAEAALTWLQSQ
ncbi:hypothetical protein U14_04472 [Candidatus Moduliflexus flocculans]|uniref:STAS/SEC14 domain-containing protein n=1 Tax=Candidatus Moduliflexus flocculans TaxID=1499966 RepID=A0A0S6W4C1_9BACT|nr:hypothetical protein U14_04472 [Candidatus Moduliflexus flocculans]